MIFDIRLSSNHTEPGTGHIRQYHIRALIQFFSVNTRIADGRLHIVPAHSPPVLLHTVQLCFRQVKRKHFSRSRQFGSRMQGFASGRRTEVQNGLPFLNSRRLDSQHGTDVLYCKKSRFISGKTSDAVRFLKFHRIGQIRVSRYRNALFLPGRKHLLPLLLRKRLFQTHRYRFSFQKSPQHFFRRVFAVTIQKVFRQPGRHGIPDG